MGANVSCPDRATMGGGVRTTTIGRYASHLLGSDPDGQSKDKKKKSSKLATLRKKLIRARRHSRSFDHARAVRDLTSTWTIRELNTLVEEYEASIVLKELALLANLARPHANTYKEDLSALYDYKYCTDVDLIYKGACFPAHRAILSMRCPFFRDLLTRHRDYGAQVPINIRTPGVDVHMFSALLRYLYTGEFNIEENKFDVLVQLGDEFGVPNPLEHDLRTLLETSEYSDALLMFTSDSAEVGGGVPQQHDHLHHQAHHPSPPPAQAHLPPHHQALTPEGTSSVLDGMRTNKNELRCHKAILAARSPFFRNLLLRRARNGEELTERALRSPTCIVLDESVIPKQYARVLLHAIYLDSVDLGHIVRSSTSVCSLSEVQAMVAGKTHMTHTEEAMEIYQIAQFLDFPTLSQGCEDVIVENLSLENLVSVLTWSSQPHGSQWVHRQALHFLTEEFLQLGHSPVLHDLSKHYLIQAIKSDFLQAGELDVLNAVLKWGEQQLIKRMEEREPNLLSHTAHSVSKKGIKKRDLDDIELREIVADLLPHVRTDHVLPHSSDVLSGAIKRGLVSTPPSHMMADEGAGNNGRASAWVRGKNNGMYLKPRLFLPYYEEAKAILDEQVSQVQENEVVRLRMVQMSAIPDTLYMVDDKATCHHSHHHIHHHGHPYNPPIRHSHPHSSHSTTTSQPPGGGLPQYHQQQSTSSTTSSSSMQQPSTSPTVDSSGTILVPDNDTLSAMKRREHSLQHTKLAQRAYSLPCSDRRAVTHAVALRVVREFGLPDTTVEILQSAHALYMEEPLLEVPRFLHPPRVALPVARPPHLHERCIRHTSPSNPVSPARSYSPIEKEPTGCGDSILSDMMPDIAMATASMNQVSLQDHDLSAHGDLELDLGDGNSHTGGSGGVGGSGNGGGSGGTGTLYI